MVNAEGSDLVTFAIVVENTGTGLHGAFNVQINDTLPAGFHIPALGTQGINLSVTDGTGSTIPFTNIGAGTGLLNLGIQLTDASAIAGSLAPFDTTNGKNIAIITYDLQVDASTDNANSTLTNTATLINYTTSPAGPVFLLTPLTDPATVTISSPSLAKVLIGTSINTATNDNTHAVVGELATYTLTLTVPQGTTPSAKIVDTLPAGMAYVTATLISIDAGITTANPLTIASAVVTSGGGGTGNVVTFNPGTITNSNTTDTGANHITITYQVVVLDVASNVSNVALTNSAQLSFTGSSVVAPVSAAPVTVIEPKLKVTKTATVNGVAAPAGQGDAGDPIVYTMVIQHNTPSSQTDAFDVTFTDTIPADINPMSFTVTDSLAVPTVTAANFQLVLQTISTTGTGFDFPYDTTRTITIQVTGTIRTSAFTGEMISNSSTVNWTSLSGNPGTISAFNPNSTERTGAGGVNNYTNTSTNTFQVFTPVPVKNIVATSQTPNANLPLPSGTLATPQDNLNHVLTDNATIGEIVRFHLASKIAEGTTTNLIIQDTLPTGMMFIDDGSAKVAFVSNGAGFTSTTVGTNPGWATPPTLTGNNPDMTPLTAFPAANVASNNTFSTHVYGNGTTVFFGFGTVINSDNDADTEYVVIEFNALVLNTAANVVGKKLSNNFTVNVNGTTYSTTTSADTTIVEPKLTINKTVAPAAFDAGDLLTYTITIANTGNATAYGIAITDILDANLLFNNVSTFSKPAGTTVTVAGTTPVLGANGTVTVNADNLPAGQSIVLTLQVNAISTLSALTTIPNTATVKYTSVPPTFGTVNATGSVLTMGSNQAGSATGWRDGTALIAPDNYTASKLVNVTSNAPAVDKQNPSVARATIGDSVTYDILVTVPEGTTRSLSVNDFVPAGMTMQSFTVIKTAAGSPLLGGVDFAGAFVTNPSPSMPSAEAATVTFGFGNVTVPANAGTMANKFVIRVVVRVENDIANQIHAAVTYTGLTTTFLNTANLKYLPNTSGVLSTVTDSTPLTPTAVTLREPLLSITKTIKTPASPADAGDVVQYQVVLANPTLAAQPDGADANQVVLKDTLPTGILVTSIVSETLVNGTVGTSTITTPAAITGLGTGLTGSYFIPVGGSVTVVYNATIQNTASANGAIANLADVQWNSQPIANPNGRGSSNDTTKTLNTPLVLNDYELTSTTSFTTTSPAIDKKDPSVSRATIGDLVTYDILVTLPEGTTRGVAITDNIPTGMNVESFSTITAAGGLLANPFTGSFGVTSATALPATGTATFAYGDTVVPGTVGDSGNQFVIRVNLRVLNIITNQIQAAPTYSGATTMFNNTASLAYLPGASATPSTVIDGTPPAAVTLKEPVLTVAKTIKTPASPPDAGGVVTYQVVINNPNNTDAADAYQVVLTDTMPSGLLVTGVTPDVATGGATINLTSAATGGGTGLSGKYTIPVGGTVTVTYSATIQSTAPAGGMLTNLADVKWNSQPSGLLGRDGSNGLLNTTGTLNDYDVQSSTTFTGGSPIIHKSDPSQPKATIGEIVTYDILVTLPEGLTQSVKVLENIPGYMALDQFDIDTTTAQSALLTANFAGTFTTTPSSAGLPSVNAAAGSSTYTFDFGNVNIPGTAGATKNQFVIRVYLRPLNDIHNQIQAAPTYPATTPTYQNTANLSFIPGGSVTPTIINDATTPALLTLREPVLSITKSIQTLPNPVDAGGVVTYQIVLTNPTITDGATANNAVLTDTMPADLQVTFIQSETLAGGATALANAGITGGGTGLSGKYTIPMGGSVTVVYNATIRQSATPVEAMKNVADVQWTSLSGANTNGRSSSNSPTKLLNTSGVLDDYELQSTTTFNTVNGSIVKALAATSEPSTTGSNVTLGEVVTYNLTVTLPEGTTPMMTITDTLPSGLIFVTGSPVVNATGLNGTVSTFTTTPTTAVGGDLITFTFANPTTVVADNVTTNNSFILSFQARVRDIPANVGTAVLTQTSLTNTTATLKAGTAPTVNSPSGVTVTVVEPVLGIVKSFSPVSPAAPNDTITITFVATNTGLSTAFEPIVTDILDIRFTNVTAATTPAGYTFAYNAGTNTMTYTAAPGVGIAPGAGNAVTFTFTAKIVSTAVQGDVLANSVTISNLTTLPGATNQPDERIEPPATGVANLAIVTPDMVVTKTDNSVAHTVVPGQLLTYTLTVQNVGPHDATGVVLHEIVPPNMTYVSGGSSAWVVPVAGTPLPDGSVSGTPAQINIGNVAAGAAPVNYSFVVRVNATVPSGITTIDNTTTVNDDGTHGSDPTPPNNTATDTVNVTAAPDLVITKTDNQGGATTPGATVTYTLTVQNVGNQDATGAQVKETVPANTTYVTAGSSAWLVTGGGSVLPNGSAASTLAEIEIGNIAAGAPPLIFTFVVLNNATLPAGVTQTLNTATTNDDAANGPDPTPTNNTASDPIPITATPDMVVTKTDDAGGIVVPGQTVTYTLTVQNVGNQDATGVVLHETVPPNMTYVQAGSSAWQLTPPSGPLPNGAPVGTLSQITIGNAAAKAAATTYIYKTIVNATVPVGTTSITNTTTVNDDGSNGPDPTLPNNTATDTISLVAVPDLVVTKIDNSGGAFVPGQTYTYTITVKNVGQERCVRRGASRHRSAKYDLCVGWLSVARRHHQHCVGDRSCPGNRGAHQYRPGYRRRTVDHLHVAGQSRQPHSGWRQYDCEHHDSQRRRQQRCGSFTGQQHGDGHRTAECRAGSGHYQDRQQCRWHCGSRPDIHLHADGSERRQPERDGRPSQRHRATEYDLRLRGQFGVDRRGQRHGGSDWCICRHGCGDQHRKHDRGRSRPDVHLCSDGEQSCVCPASPAFSTRRRRTTMATMVPIRRH